jgi:hypothetical protein
VHVPLRGRIAAGTLASLLSTSCMVARYEEVPSDRRRLASGQEVAVVWPHAGQPTPTVIVDYVSVTPAQLEEEARRVFEEIRPEVEKKNVHRVALQAMVVEKGLKWRDGRPSFWRAHSTVYWYGRRDGGPWTEGDPGVHDTGHDPRVVRAP